MHDTRHIPIENRVSEAALEDLVVRHYAIRPVSIAVLGGYSNLNYRLTDPAGRAYVLRVSRLNRLADSAGAEAHVLRSLERQGYGMAPHLIDPVELVDPVDPLKRKSPLRVEIGGAEHYIQLSHLIPGSIDCYWWQHCSIDKLEQIFRGLAGLHQAMAAVPALQEVPAPAFQYVLPEQAPELLAATATGQYVLDNWVLFRQSAIRLQIDMANHYPWQDARYQWIHGDVQLENVLFERGYLTGFLDFERVSWDACEKDVIFSAFRVCKEGNTDTPFLYDPARLARAIEAYREKEAGLCSYFFSGYGDLWKPMFCLDQAMVYLENAFDGSWQLAEGIGFLPVFNEVLQYRNV